MCGVVKNPTKVSAVNLKLFPKLGKRATSIAQICEDSYIPQEATNIVLLMAEKFFPNNDDWVIKVVSFTKYYDGKRFVTAEGLDLEKSVMHLAMASSVIFDINQVLASIGMMLNLGHCCAIQMHNLKYANKAMSLSRDGNVWRADMLRLNPETVEIPFSDFLNIQTQAHGSLGRFDHLILEALVSVKEKV